MSKDNLEKNLNELLLLSKKLREANKDLRNKLGKNSRNYAIRNFEKYKILNSLNKKILSKEKKILI